MFGVRDIKFLDISNTGNFFNSLIGRSILGMIGFTFVSYAITTISPKKTPPLIPFLDNNNTLQSGGTNNIEKFSIPFTNQKSMNDNFRISQNLKKQLNQYNHNDINGNEKLLSYYQI
jgi:hypothetical protein